MDTEEIITTYRLRVPQKLWDSYKETVSKAQTMNEALVGLIQAEVELKVELIRQE